MAYEFDTSGRLKPPSNEAAASADAATDIVALVTGTAADGSAYFVYLAVPPSKYRAFVDATRRGEPMDLSGYGRVLCDGHAPSPSDDVRRMMRDQYGFDEEFEQRLIAEVLKEQAGFLKEQEEKRLGDIVAMLKKQNKEE